MMAGWSREQMIDAGLLVYSGVLKDVAHFAGVYEQDDWLLVDERAQRFKPLMNDEYGNSAIAELVGLISLTSQNRSPHHMARYSKERGEMWSQIPYSVLADDELDRRASGRWAPASPRCRRKRRSGDDPGQADPGRVQRRRRKRSARRRTTCATTTTTAGSRTTRATRARTTYYKVAQASWRSCATGSTLLGDDVEQARAAAGR